MRRTLRITPMRMIRSPRAALAAGAAVLVLAGCAAEPSGSPGAGSPGAGDLAGPLTVYAAASLGAAFDELTERFQSENPDVEVRPVVYDGSRTLAAQILEGAPADVFAAADEATMADLQDAGLALRPRPFATNTLVIAVPAGNPAGVRGLADLARPEATVVLCAPEVPCGAASVTLLGNEGVTAAVDGYEQNVTAVLTKVAAGEADAGLVYATDIARADGVRAVRAEGADAVVNRYPVSALAGAADPKVADAFVEFVTSAAGLRVLADAGFGAP
ncbi:molybdate ABC transporter substrate-binding protein [Microbacterium aureliae]